MVEITGIEVGDDPDAWRAVGFAVDEAGTCRIGSIPLHLVGTDRGRGILGWTLRGLTGPPPADGTIDGLPTSTDGTDTATGDGRDAVPAPVEHPIGATRIDHVVVLAPDLGRLVSALATVGLEPRRTRDTDTYGFPAQQVFYRLGEAILEVVGAADPTAGPPGADPAQPARFFGLAMTVTDLDAAADRLAPHVGRVKPAVQEGRRIATIRHRELHLSVAIALMSPDP